MTDALGRKKDRTVQAVVLGVIAALPAAVHGQEIVLAGMLGEMFLRSGRVFIHGQPGDQDMNPSGVNSLMLASAEGSTETGGFYGDDDTMVLWNPGDGASTDSMPPQALLYVLDEDNWDDADSDPFDNGALKTYLDANGVWQVSGAAQKTNVARLETGLARVMALNGYSYELVLADEEIAKGQEAPSRLGVMAHELQQVLPEAVSENAYGEMWVNYSQITPLLIEAIKEQQELIRSLERRLEILEARRAF